MNRRDVLMLLGIAACGPRRTPAGGGSRGGGSRDATTTPTQTKDGGLVITDDWSNARTTQLYANPLIVRGEQIARLTAEALDFIDAGSLKVTDRVTERYRSACAWKGTLFGFTHPENGPCQIDMFEKTLSLRSMPIAGCSPNDGAHVAAAGNSNIYVSNGYDSLTRYRVQDGALTEDMIFRLDERARSGLGQMLGLDDGRVLVPAGRALLAYGGSEPTTHTTSQRTAHLCAGSNGRVWYSMYNEDRVLDTVVLARLGTSLSRETAISLAPGRVTHMASSPDGSLAIVSVTQGTSAWQWTIRLLDANGSEKRRITVDDDIAQSVDIDLNAAFVALTPTVVVLDAGRHGLVGWSASTGARL